VGACIYPDQASDKRELLQRADRALYRIKASGKGRWGWWAPEAGSGVEPDPAAAGPSLP
jgi:predicted signal transduction protein with EAL and GGDEF domain